MKRIKTLNMGWILAISLLLIAATGSTVDFMRFREAPLPSSGMPGELRLDSSDRKLKLFDAVDSEWNVLGSGGGGSGQGRVNFIENSGFENNLDGWDGSPTYLDIAQETSSTLIGAGSLKITKGSVDASNVYVAASYGTGGVRQLDNAYLGTPLFLSFYYNANHANYVSDDLRVRVYDVTNNQYLLVQPVMNVTSNNGLFKYDGILQGAVKVSPVSTTARLRVEFVVVSDSAPSSSWETFVDDVLIGPDSPTPTVGQRSQVLNLNGSYNGGSIRVSKVGDQVTISALSAFTHSSASSAASSSGLIPAWARPSQNKDTLWTFAGTDYVGHLRIALDGTISTTYRDWAGNSSNQTNVSLAQTITYNVDTSEGNLMSSFELSLKSLVARAARISSSQTINTATTGRIDFNGILEDPFGTITTGASWVFTAPKRDYYIVNPSIYFTAQPSATGTSQSFFLIIYKNGSEFLRLDTDSAVSTTNKRWQLGNSKLLLLEKDDTIDFRLENSSGGNASVNVNTSIIEIYSWSDLVKFGAYSNAGETIEVTGTITPATGAFQVTTGIPLPTGKWKLEFSLLPSQNGNASTTGVAIYLATGNSTGSAEQINARTRGDIAVNGTIGGLGTVYETLTITSPTTYYGKTSAYGASFSSAAQYKLTATRLL